MQTLQRKLVLLAEDDRDLRELAAVELRRSGYAVLEAGDGREALELAAKHGPDLAVLDVPLPRAVRPIDAPVIVLPTGDLAVLRARVADALAA